MKIQDLENRTGLDRATIRYYEKMGLITPTRAENGYRDYSEEDKEQLLKIKLLRQLGMSIERIEKLQQGSDDFQAVLQQQITALHQLRDTAQRSVQICQMMRDDGVSYDTMNAEYYIRQLRQAIPQYPQKTIPAPQENFSEPNIREFHPWRRFFARCIDLILLSAVIIFVQIVFFRSGLLSYWINPFSFLAILLLVPIEAFCLRYLGTTPGKWAMGIRVLCSDGCRHSGRSALERAMRVCCYGWGFGIPGVNIWRLWRSYKDYWNDGETRWDDESEIEFQSWNWKLLKPAAILIVIVAIMLSVGFHYIKLPKNTNTDLTIEQFVENYNYYWEISGSSSTWALLADGSFREPDNAVIILGYDRVFDDFQYTLEQDHVTAVSYQERVRDIKPYTSISPLPQRASTAAAALLTAQKGQNTDSVTDMYALLEQQALQAIASGANSFALEYGGILVEWRIEYENIRIMDGQLWGEESVDTNSVEIAVTISVLSES